MSIKTITIRIVIPPENLNKDITTVIKEYSNEKICFKEYGYITDIIKINSWNSLISRTNGSNIITAIVEANTFLPKVGLTIDCIVTMIFPQCIFAEYIDLKVVIPSSELKNYTYINQMFKYNEKIIKVGDIIKVDILNVRYKKQKFSCIGKLKN